MRRLPAPQVRAPGISTIAAGQTIANTASGVIAFDDETFDTDVFHDNATDNTRHTVPVGKAGKYVVCYVASWVNGATVTGQIDWFVRKNGAAVSEGWNTLVATELAASARQTRCGDGVLALADGDYVELGGTNNSGATISVDANLTLLQLIRIGS